MEDRCCVYVTTKTQVRETIIHEMFSIIGPVKHVQKEQQSYHSSSSSYYSSSSSKSSTYKVTFDSEALATTALTLNGMHFIDGRVSVISHAQYRKLYPKRYG